MKQDQTGLDGWMDGWMDLLVGPRILPWTLSKRSQGLKVSGSQGLRVSRSQGLKVSRSQGLKVSRSQGLKVSRSQGDNGSVWSSTGWYLVVQVSIGR